MPAFCLLAVLLHQLVAVVPPCGPTWFSGLDLEACADSVASASVASVAAAAAAGPSASGSAALFQGTKT